MTAPARLVATSTMFRSEHHLRVRPPPTLEPPYDDDEQEQPPRQALRLVSSDRPKKTRSKSTIAQQLALDDPWEEPSLEQHSSITDGSSWYQHFGRQPTPRNELPAPQLHAHKLAQAVVEALAGRRPIQQLMPWLSESIYGILAAQTRPHPIRPHRIDHPLVTTLRVCEPDDGIAEASAVVRHGEHAYALAMRLEGLDGRWHCTIFDIV